MFTSHDTSIVIITAVVVVGATDSTCIVLLVVVDVGRVYTPDAYTVLVVTCDALNEQLPLESLRASIPPVADELAPEIEVPCILLTTDVELLEVISPPIITDVTAVGVCHVAEDPL